MSNKRRGEKAKAKMLEGAIRKISGEEKAQVYRLTLDLTKRLEKALIGFIQDKKSPESMSNEVFELAFASIIYKHILAAKASSEYTMDDLIIGIMSNIMYDVKVMNVKNNENKK